MSDLDPEDYGGDLADIIKGCAGLAYAGEHGQVWPWSVAITCSRIS